MSFLVLDRVSKRFGGLEVLREVSLEVEEGEIYFLLGPSGCGKTTLLRLVAGLVAPDQGQIWCDGQNLANVPTHRRNLGMVVQNFALWPHQTVEENVVFGLAERSCGREETQRRLAETLRLVGLTHKASQSVRKLSGGEQQRVALARALIYRPRLLLLDEPLSNLDAELRSEMRELIQRLCRETKLTALYVTHDSADATAIGDRIGTMHNGRVHG